MEIFAKYIKGNDIIETIVFVFDVRGGAPAPHTNRILKLQAAHHFLYTYWEKKTSKNIAEKAIFLNGMYIGFYAQHFILAYMSHI